MKSLQQVKDEISAQYGHKYWENGEWKTRKFDELWLGYPAIQEIVDLIAMKYAEEVLKEAAKKAKLIDVSGKTKGGNIFEVDKNSILQIVTELK